MIEKFKNLFLYYPTKNKFNSDLENGLIDDNSIAFIAEDCTIYTHGAKYGGGSKIKEGHCVKILEKMIVEVDGESVQPTSEQLDLVNGVYILLVFNDQEEPVYIPANKLVDVYTAADISVQNIEGVDNVQEALEDLDNRIENKTIGIDLLSEDLRDTIQGLGATIMEVTVEQLDSLHNIQSITGSGSGYYNVVDRTGNDRKKVGVLLLFTDNMGHQITQVLTTHYTFTDSLDPVGEGTLAFNSHDDTKIHTLYRSYGINSPHIQNGMWTNWKRLDADMFLTINDSLSLEIDSTLSSRLSNLNIPQDASDVSISNIDGMEDVSNVQQALGNLNTRISNWKDTVVSSGRYIEIKNHYATQINGTTVDPMSQQGNLYYDLVDGTYLELTIQNGNPVYIPSDKLVDIYTAAQNAQLIQVAIDDNNKISASIVNGSIGTNQLTTELLNTIAGKANSSNVYTKAETDLKITQAVTGGLVDLSGYAKTEDIPTKTSDLINDSNFLTQHQDISGKADVSTVNSLTTTVNAKANTSDVYTKAESDAKYLTEHLDISGKVDAVDLASVATTGSYNDLSNKPTVPTKTSLLTNDSGFITDADIPEGAAASTTIPLADSGTGSIGTSNAFARGDHRHPSDTTKANVSELKIEDVSGSPDKKKVTLKTGTSQEFLISHQDISGKVDKTTTVNGHALSGNVTVTKSDVDLGNVTNDAQVKRTEMGVANGVASLDAAGKVPAAQLPSYVDDVVEAATKSAFPTTGESGKIYISLNDNKTYRWGGSAYVEISESLALGETASTAFAGNRGKALEDAISNTYNKTEVDQLVSDSVEAIPASEVHEMFDY